MRTETVGRVGGFRTVIEGTQEWNLILRLSAAAGPARIRHIPRDDDRSSLESEWET